MQIGKRYPVDVGLAGDADRTLAWLTREIQTKSNRSFLTRCQTNMRQWWARMEREEDQEGIPLKPQKVIRALQRVVHDDAVLSVDVGNVTVWMARHFRMSNQNMVISSWLATLGCGLLGAIAAKIAYPDKQVIAVCGDGGFAMMMSDFVSAVTYNLPIVVVVLNNHKIAMIKFEQEVMGNAEFATDLQNPHFARFADICGGVGFRVEKTDELLPALQQAVASGKPCIVDVLVDADEAPLPATVTFGQAAGYAKHMWKELFEEGKIDVAVLT